jgi:hypothetical protein
MANLDLSDKALYSMVNPNVKVPANQLEDEAPNVDVRGVPAVNNGNAASVAEANRPLVTGAPTTQPRKMKRTFKNFLLFVATVALVVCVLYFLVYRLGWGVSECMNKNYHNCATLLTPEVAPLAALGLAGLM